MTLRTFLKALDSETQVTLVGPLASESIHADTPCIYIDGGSRFRPTEQDIVRPEISVGDGDSSNVHLDVTLPARKDHSDLAYVFRQLPQCIKCVHMFGFLGGRRDHELANFGEIHNFLTTRNEFTQVHMFGAPSSLKAEVIAWSRGPLELEIHGIFSVFAFEPTNISIVGSCEYELKEAQRFPVASSFGLSNVGHGSVLLVSQGPSFVFLN